MNAHTKQRKRRRAKALLMNPASVRKHKRQAGRTGHVHAKKARGKASGYSCLHPNPPVCITRLGEQRAAEARDG